MSSPGSSTLSFSGVSPGRRWKPRTGTLRLRRSLAISTVASRAAIATAMSPG